MRAFSSLSLFASLACAGRLIDPPTSTTFTVGNVPYLSPVSPILESCSDARSDVSGLSKVFDGGSALLTVLKLKETVIDKDALSSALGSFAETDDVWTDAFLDVVAIASPPNSTISSDAHSFLTEKRVQYVITAPGVDAQASSSSQIPALSLADVGSLKSGPYYIDIGPSCAAVREVYRLYPDSLQAFTQGITPVPGSTAFSTSSIFDPDTESLVIPVPSRLYSLDDPRPLSGLRVAVKDLYFIEGIKTGGGSRVRLEMYPENNSTAPSVEKLLDLGAVAVGITKTSQFANGVEPWEWNDFIYPKNPRGDGWLAIAYSSSGSGAAISGYEWLDFALGSDTGGSVRMPASLGGSYGIRPTHNAVTLNGILPLASEFDTAGFFARDPSLFAKIGPLWYDNGPVPANRSFSSFPKQILVPVDYFPLKNPKAQEVLDGFIATVEAELGIATKSINVTQVLSGSDNPYISDPAGSWSLTMTSVNYDSWNGLGKELVERWEAAHPDAGFPPFDSAVRDTFAARNLTREEYDEATAQKGAFRKYGEEHLMPPSDETCSESLLLLESGASGRPCYREKALSEQPGAGFLYFTDPGPWINPVSLSPLLSTPQISIPIGQVEYESPISSQTEYLPVVIDLMAAHGCDGMLYELVDTLAEKGVLKAVKTGRTAF